MDLGSVKCWPCCTLPTCAPPTILWRGPPCRKWWRCWRTRKQAPNSRRSVVCNFMCKRWVYPLWRKFPRSRMVQVFPSSAWANRECFVLCLTMWCYFVIQDDEVPERWDRRLYCLVSATHFKCNLGRPGPIWLMKVNTCFQSVVADSCSVEGKV